MFRSILHRSNWYALVGMTLGLYADNKTKPTSGTSSNDDGVLHVLQKPGGRLYIPFGHLHAVYNLQDCIGVTEKYGAPMNDWQELWNAVALEGDVEHNTNERLIGQS
jgi:hypothetical protein